MYFQSVFLKSIYQIVNNTMNTEYKDSEDLNIDVSEDVASEEAIG